ncbi:purine nucleoside transporter PunC [Ferrimonas senticii]|uniref:purine nucleoside transporter PunC n=1 Tax=Ferrimonas senticii TaxID=394566 RepID=UPI00040822A0|nr:purine nucleoside transporter PunC [Ferrimonas senticii]
MSKFITKIELGYLSLLSMLGFVATDMYLPAFKQMEMALATSAEGIALSLSVFLAGLAGGQLLWGILSDRIGRRSALIAGLTLFGLASAAISFCTEVWQLQLLRFIQAIGVCAPTVIWQALVIDRYTPSQSQQIFATVMPLVALSPALAPQLGVVLADAYGWRSIFLFLTVLAIALVAYSVTLPKADKTVKPQPVMGDIKQLLSSRYYMGHVLIFASASAAFFAYLTGLPEIMHLMGYDAADIGLSFVPQTIAFMVGGLLGKRWVARHGDAGLLKALLATFALVAAVLLVVALTPQTTIWPLLIPFCVSAAVNGALYPIVVNRSLSHMPHCAATAAGLQNTLQISISFGASALVASFAEIPLQITGIAIAIAAALLLSGYALSHFGKAK